MNRVFFERKIRELDDHALVDLLKLRNAENEEVFQLALREAIKRNLEIKETDLNSPLFTASEEPNSDRLKNWNWGAFFLAPIWVLVNNLEWWLILFVIPFINIAAGLYLGFHGNKLAFKKSNLGLADFLILQNRWNVWGKRVFWVSLIVGVIFLALKW